MHEFSVWAPFAQTVAVEVEGSSISMTGPDEDGWWIAAVDKATNGTDYGFHLDEGKTAYPDPRSQWQPNGVHALSRVYDQSAFRWSDDGFQATPLASAVVYELHV